MRLKILERGSWTVTAVEEMSQSGQYDCPFETTLMSLGPNYDRSVDGLLALLEKLAQHGIRILNTDLCHEADSNNKIFEFIKGDIRLLWFYGAGNKIIICSHAFIKKRQKTPEAEKNRAIAIKDRYMKLVDSGKTVELVEQDDE